MASGVGKVSQVWVGPVMGPGARQMGMSTLGNPVMADDDGVVEMQPIGRIFTDLHFETEPVAAPGED